MPNEATFSLKRKEGVTHPIGPQGLTLGRDSSNDLVVHDDQVVARHARILVSGGRCFIRDERKSGGTFVNGERVAGQQELFPGDIVQLGSTVFKFSASQPEKPASTQIAPAPAPLPKTQDNQNRRKNIVFAGLAFSAAVLILLIMVMALSSGGPSPAVSTSTNTPTNSPTPVAEPVIVETESPTVETPPPTATSTPVYLARLICTELDPQIEAATCTVTNLGNAADTLSLSFNPYVQEELNGFELSIKIQDQEELLKPDPESGLVKIGLIHPQAELIFAIRMVCIEKALGCLETDVTAKLFVKDGQTLIIGEDGESVIRSFHPTPTPRPAKTATNTPKPPKKPTKQPDEGPGD